MNKRILKLAEQANELDYETFDEYNHKTVQHYKFDKEKFAELIVRECARVAKITEPYDNKEYVLGRKWAGVDVLDHFGVEE